MNGCLMCFSCGLCPTLPRDALCLGLMQSQEGNKVPIIFNFFQIDQKIFLSANEITEGTSS